MHRHAAARVANELVDWFAGDGRGRGPRTMLVVAHPDDETVGAGGRLAEIDPLAVVVTTDGAPRDPWFASAAGCEDRPSYAALRRRELEAALRAGGVALDRAEFLGMIDQESAFALEALAEAVLLRFRTLRPEVVLTHPYEGGHPDHDAAAFAVQAAARALGAAGPVVLELAFYHQAAGVPVWGRFRGAAGRRVLLRGERWRRKRAMLDCYASQARVLSNFPIEIERVRAAPDYDFTRPPPPGRFQYDAFRWPVRGADFLEHAALASVPK